MTSPSTTTRSTFVAAQPQRRRRRPAVALLTTALLVLGSTSPALAGKPDKGGSTDSGGSTDADGTIQDCGTILQDSVTPNDVRRGLNAQGGRSGAGVGIAVLDTGITPMPGLEGHVDGVDLSFDSGTDALRGLDLFGHGTAMASIAAASPALIGGEGVAPGAHLVDVKVGAGNGAVDVSQVIAGIDWVVANREEYDIDVLLLAYNTDGIQSHLLDPLNHAVESAWKNGVTVVVAGGNDGRSVGKLGNPAYNPYVIAVGAAQQVRKGWTVPTWSSTGDGTRNPDVVAPGSMLLANGVPGSFLATQSPQATCLDKEGNLLIRGSGTSHAAAVTAGAVALLLEDRPDLTPDQVKHLLTTTATDLTANPKQQGHGLIDIEAAIAAPTPGLEAVQTHPSSTGLGKLHQARGTMVLDVQGNQLTGEETAFGTKWDAREWAPQAATGTAWTDTYDADGIWAGATWSGATWSGATWSGATWSGATWSGATWSGATWSGATWSGATWSGATWSGATWSGATWSGATWSGATWSGAVWTGASWTGASWTGASWTGASWT